jgi:hypothetical protein
VDQRPALHALLPGFSPRSSSLQAPSFCGAACYYSEQEGSSVRFCLLHSSAIGYHFFSKIDASGIGPGASFGGVTLTLQGLGSVRPVSVEGVMDTGTKFATSAFQHDDPVTLNAQGHGHRFIDRIQHLTSHKVLGNCDDLGSSP